MRVVIEQIKDTKVDNLSISWDEEDGTVMLFTPYMDDTGEHYHIELSDEECTKLFHFLKENVPSIAEAGSGIR